MNKTAIRNYAVWARVQLIEAVKQKAFEYEITEGGENSAILESAGGRLLSAAEKEQRKELISQIKAKGYSQVMEEAAYTWFNRFIALRFMEVNGYLPSKIRVFTDENGEFKPEILKQAITVEIEGLNHDKVLDLLYKQDNDELYKYLIITQCNALNAGLPYMFEKISNWTELLFPDNLLRADSVLDRMVKDIPEEDWTDQVQIIGWLYQYYNAEVKNDVFTNLKKNIKISKDKIPAATQIFTPDWIVRYMVENSLGRLWYEGHKSFDKSEWKYYLDEAEQEPDVQANIFSLEFEKADNTDKKSYVAFMVNAEGRQISNCPVINAKKAGTYRATFTLKSSSFHKININCSVDKPKLPDIKLEYSESPDSSLINYADDLLSLLGDLTQKIRKFIKQNNIYGSEYKKQIPVEIKLKEGKTYTDLFEKAIRKTQKAIEKHYVVDIFSDGSDELIDMLKVLWNGIGLLTCEAALKKNWLFSIEGASIDSESELKKELIETLNKRYCELDRVISSENVLSDEREDDVFAVFNKMVQLDTFDIFSYDKGALMPVGQSENELNKLIGLETIKESIKKIKAYAISNKDSSDLNLHMCFLGNPGSGKTEVARIIAGILFENHILPSKKVVEVDRSGLVSQYFGATAEKTKQVIESAMGGVLFVDEAYALANNSDSGGITDYGKEAIDTLVKAMEDSRGKFCVIFAGYKNEMQKMISANPGMKSRIQFELDFPNYSRSELKQIASIMLSKRKYHILQEALDKILDITDVKRKEPNFANAREIRNILDQVIMCQNLRVLGTDDKTIELVDINKYIKDAKISLPTSGSGATATILTGDEELDKLIGLHSVKKMLKKIKAYAKRNSEDSSFNLHMCFYGNPGTGKTEVARILSRILYDAGVLDESKLVETDSHGLIGKFAGETGPKTEQKIKEAMGGVLFIDEAYALTAFSTGTNNYGDEAIAVLLKGMEDYRGKFCAILAGYKNEMQEMLSSNPGFESRIQFTLDFPDYTREELGEIASFFLDSKKYIIADDAMALLLDITDYYRKKPNFANARTVRNILDQVILNQNLRTDEDEESDRSLIIAEDVKEYIEDEKIDINDSFNNSNTIGFV